MYVESPMRIFDPWRDLGTLPREAWLLFWTNLANRAGMMVLPFLILYLTTERGLSAGRAGLVLAAAGITTIVAAPVAGRVADRIGPLPVMRVSLATAGCLLFVYPFAQTFWQLIAITVVWSFFDVSFRPASLKLMTQSVEPANRKSAFALFRLAINLGMSVGPAIGGFLATVSFRSIFWVDGATSIIAASILFLFREKRIVAADAKAIKTTSRRKSSLLRDHPYLIFLVGNFLVTFVFFQHDGALPLYLVRTLHQSPAFYGMLFTLNTLVIVALEIPLTSMTANWPYSRSLGIGGGLVTIGFGALAVADSALLVVLTVLLWTFGEMLLFPALAAFLGDVAPSEASGLYMGAYTTSTQLGFALGASVGAFLYAGIGSPAVWFVMLVVGSVGTLIIARSARGHASRVTIEPPIVDAAEIVQPPATNPLS